MSQTNTKKERGIDILEGAIVKAMILYALPLIASNLLQVLFNAADVAVLGIFTEGDNAVAAVGATSSLIQLIVNLFIGLSVGTNVLVARYVGSGETERSQRVVGCSMVVAVVCGLALLFVGFFGARTFLIWMNCQEEVLDLAVTYLKIYFLGMPIMMLYNFSTAILRGIGDTVRPLIYLVVGGGVNVVLNVLFVAGFHKDVEGVAIATVASQGIAAALAIVALFKEKGAAKLSIKNCRFFKNELCNMAKIGLPSGIQGSLFSISNVLVQSAINGFGKSVMAANTIASQYDGFCYQAMYGVSLSSTVFVSQNYGAKKFDRVKKSARVSLLLTSVIGLGIGVVLSILAHPLASLMTDSAEVEDFAVKRLVLLSLTYVFCGLQESFAYSLKGLGKSLTPMFVVLGGTCLFRILWLQTLLVKYHTVTMMYLLYPASWLLTTLIFVPIYFITEKRTERRLLEETPQILPLSQDDAESAAANGK